MGGSTWSDDDWARHSSATIDKPAAAIFTNKAMVEALDPRYIKIRESRDSTAHPFSIPVIVGSDVTGSMGFLAEDLIKRGLGTVMEELLARKPIDDPQLMCMAIGDITCDEAPLQATQFETDITIVEQLEQVFVEGHGGGNSSESYTLPWYFAATKTSCDAFEKRGKKGYLFTSGDEECPAVLRARDLERIGMSAQSDLTTEQLLDMVSKEWEVFHIIVKEGSHCKYHFNEVLHSWKSVLGQRAIVLTDYKALAETIVSIIEVNEGRDVDSVSKSWSGNTALVVRDAVSGLVKKDAGTSTGVVRF